MSGLDQFTTSLEPISGPRPAEVGAVGRPPAHYDSGEGIQPFDVIDAFKLDFYEGNALKYLLRWKQKGGVQDLHKAIHYLQEVIERA